MGAIAPTAKKVVGMMPQVVQTGSGTGQVLIITGTGFFTFCFSCHQMNSIETPET